MKKRLDAVRLFFRETDKLLFFSCIAASLFGLVMVFSATRSDRAEGELFSRDFLIMAIAVVLGVAMCLAISYFNYEVFTRYWLIIGGVCILALLLLFPFGSGPESRPDARTWLRFGDLFSIQPSEFVKIGFIVTFSVHLERLRDKLNRFWSVAQLGLHALVPTALVLLTGDMGSALIFLVLAVSF